MKVEELRIGNWVMPSVDDIPYRVSTIARNYVYVELMTEITQGIKEIKPIPLTEEWLYNFGFELDNGFTTYIIKIFKGYLIVALDGSWGVYKDEYSNRTGSSYNNKIKIEYVHQLQNLYFTLTGEDLIINK